MLDSLLYSCNYLGPTGLPPLQNWHLVDALDAELLLHDSLSVIHPVSE